MKLTGDAAIDYALANGLPILELSEREASRRPTLTEPQARAKARQNKASVYCDVDLTFSQVKAGWFAAVAVGDTAEADRVMAVLVDDFEARKREGSLPDARGAAQTAAIGTR